MAPLLLYRGGKVKVSHGINVVPHLTRQPTARR
mgnify:CR=1 FL=1